jgi:preprotein translocase subunit SecG
MSWLHTATTVFHVLVGFGIVLLVLLQRGKGADAGAGFGSGASGTVFGARGAASFLSRSTATLAALFFVTSLALAYMGSRQAGPTSVIDRVSIPAPATSAPAGDVTATLPVEAPAAAAPVEPAAAPAPEAPAPQP